MFTLIRKKAENEDRSECFKNAPLMCACCVNGREDLARLVMDNVDEKHTCWSKQENIYPMHIAANFLNTDILGLVLDGECDVNITTQTKNRLFSWHQQSKITISKISTGLVVRQVSHSARKYEELVEDNCLKTLTLLQQKGADVNNHPSKLPSALAFSCQRGYVDIVQFMIRNGANVKETDEENLNALHFASEVGNIEIVQLLLESGADMNLGTTRGPTPLYLASLNGHVDVVEMFLSKDITQELKGRSIYNPFFVACKYGHIRIVERFLEYDNCILSDDTSSLLAAVGKGHEEIVELLLQNGTDANISKNASKISPLYSAAGSGYDGILKPLLNSGVNVNMETKNANTALDIASQNGHYLNVQILLENGANVNHCTIQQTTALFYAAGNGHYEIVMLLLRKKADVNICTKQGNSPLIRASSCGYENIVREILSHGADVNQSNVAGITALYLASENGHTDIVKLLLVSKADVNLGKKDGSTSMYIASRYGHHGIVQELLQHDKHINGTSSKNPLLIASYFGHYETVEILLENGANVNVQDDVGDTPLITASRKGSSGIVKILLKFRADVTLCNEEDDENALHYTCFRGHTDVVKILLDHGMDIDDHDEYTNTPLQKALEGGRLMTALFLLDHGANVNIVACDTSAPYLACDIGFKEVVNILLEANAEVNPKNPNGSSADSPLFAAVRNGYFQITKELLRRGANIVDTNEFGGETLLVKAIESRNSGIAKLLVEHGAKVNEQDKRGNTALHASA